MKIPLSWNRYPRVSPAKVVALTNRHHCLPEAGRPVLAYGNGRSYGDVCLNESATLLTTRGLDKFIALDPEKGVLRCEAGVTLAEVLALVVPKGWFLASTPGTRYATVGGALANDTHGKNHHADGTFGHHLRCFELLRSDGQRLVCSPDTHAEYFHATIGGLGLTGLVTWLEIQLKPIDNAFMWAESRRFGNLEEFWSINREAESAWPYTVAWIDCLAKGRARGRGVYFAGRHASDGHALPHYRERQRQILLDPPFSLVNNWSLRTFNEFYYRQPVEPQGSLTHYAPYFYPLDSIRDWNRIYGSKGFFQYQCVLPPETSRDGIAALLDAVSASGQGSFLAVLKTFGEQPSLGLLSFARPGTTLALDFPNRGQKTLRLFDRLDTIVKEAGGALYPAKDARMSADMFQHSFPQWQSFCQYLDPGFSSRFWRRVTQAEAIKLCKQESRKQAPRNKATVP